MGNMLGLQTTHASNGGTSKPVNIIKVSARSRTAAVAGAIAGVMRESQHAEVQAIGAGATPMRPAEVMPWGQTIAYVADINGFWVELCTPMG